MINYSLGRGLIQPIGHLEDYKVFLLYINKFKYCFQKDLLLFFSEVLGGVTRAIGESSTFIPSWLEVRTNTSDFRTNTLDFCIGPSDLCRYRPILRPISFVVRYDHSYHQFIHCNIISTSSGYEH